MYRWRKITATTSFSTAAYATATIDALAFFKNPTLFLSFHHSHQSDATDEEQSSDDEAPEEVSAAAATALAGRRRKAEQQARQAAPKRKRARTTKGGGNKNASGSTGGGEGDGADGDSNDADELELPPDLLLKVKSGGLQRMEADVLAAREAEDAARKDALAKDGNETRGRVRAGDIARRYGCSGVVNAYPLSHCR